MTIEFLEELRSLVLRVKRDELRVNSLKSKLYSPQGLNTDVKVQSSGNESDALVDIVCDMEQTLEAERAELDRMSRIAEESFRVLDDEHRKLMLLRYNCGFTWTEIMSTMHYSSSSIYRKRKECFMVLLGGSNGMDEVAKVMR